MTPYDDSARSGGGKEAPAHPADGLRERDGRGMNAPARRPARRPILAWLGAILVVSITPVSITPVGASPASAQQALVLSTGASRGLAHAGAIRGLDSLGWDPDTVVGTSMGAVIGALYAAGYEPGEIWDLLRAADWGDLFKAQPLVLGPEREVRFPMLVMGVRLGELETSPGFVAAWRVNRHLTRLLFEAGAASRGVWDRLPRRYRTVATDLSTGEAVVLARGDLARSVRASMGVPGFFEPLEANGRLLTDGGVADYLPISVAREMGASLVIAVDVSRPDPRMERMDPAAVGARSIGLLMRNAAKDTLADVLVRPAIDTDFPGAVFPEDASALLRLGLEAALEAPPPDGAKRRHRTLPPVPERFAGLRVEVSDPALESMTRARFEDVAPGPYDRELVLARVDELYATGLVSGVWPRVEEGDPAGDTLVVRVDLPSRTYVAAAAGYDSDRGGRAWAGGRRMLSLGSPAELTLGASHDDLERWGQMSVRIQSLRRPLSWTFGGYYHGTDTRFFEEDGIVEEDVRRAGGWVGTEIRTIDPDWVGVLAFQGEWINVEEGPEGWSAGPLLRVVTTPAPNLVVGGPSELDVRLRLGDVSYGSVSLRGSRRFPLPGLRAAALLAATATGGDPPHDVLPALGDRHMVPGLRWGEGRGRGQLVAGVDLARPFLMGGSLRTRLRAGVAPDAVDDVGDVDAWVGGAALEGLWSLPFGPVTVGVSASTTGGRRFDVNIGNVW